MTPAIQNGGIPGAPTSLKSPDNRRIHPTSFGRCPSSFGMFLSGSVAGGRECRVFIFFLGLGAHCFLVGVYGIDLWLTLKFIVF